MKKWLKEAFVLSLPVMAGYVVLGTGFGILMKNFPMIWTIVMSIFIFAGSMQYVGVSLLTGGASLITAFFTTLMVNARHLFYGVSMIEKYRGAGIKKVYLMHTLTDETYSLLCTAKVPEGANPHNYYLAVSLFNHIYWMIGSILGRWLSENLPFDTSGIEFSMTALFVTIFVEQWMTTKEHRPALMGVGASAVCLLVFGKDNFLIPAMAAIVALITALRKVLEKGESAHE